MTTQRFISTNRPTNRLQATGVTISVAGTAGDEIELRINTVTSAGHNMTEKEVIDALMQFKRILIMKGKDLLGANLPIGAPTAGG